MFVLSLLLCVCVAAAAATSDADKNTTFKTFSMGLQGLEIAPKPLTYLVYGNSRLSIWGHLDNPNRAPEKRLYFVTPVVMLIPESAVCGENFFSGATAIQFKVLMWDENVASFVLPHLRQVTENQKLSSLQVTILPIEQIRLAWSNSASQLSMLRLNTHWRSYANQDNVLTFEIVVSPAELCPAKVKQLKERPSSLLSLELQYVLHGTRASRKRVAVNGQHILQTKMYAQLKNKADTNTGNVFLNSDDLNELAREAVSKVVASSITDADYVDSGDKASLAKLVKDNLDTSKQSMAEMTPKMWESTFWQNEFARPDKLTSYLNKIMKKDRGRNHTISIDRKMEASEISGGLGLNYGGGLSLFGIGGLSTSMGAKGSGSRGVANESSISEGVMRAWLRKNHNEVEWNGEKFKVKPMYLHRLNTQQLNQQQDITTTNVQVHHYQYTSNVPVSFPGEAMEGNETQSTFAITKRLDEVEVAISKEISDRNSAIAKEVADRKAADTKEMDERNSATAESQKAIAQLRTANGARFDVLFAQLPDVERYQGQLFKVFDNPFRSWDGASDVCASQGGIPATALSKHLMLKIQHIIPVGTEWKPMVVIGLQSSKSTTGWRWVDRDTGKIIDIGRGNTVKPLWFSQQPDVNLADETCGAIFNRLVMHSLNNMGFYFDPEPYGVSSVAITDPKLIRVLCQFAFPMYEFKPFRVGARMTFPHESSASAATLAACTESCRKSAFCRTFSYSTTSKDCQHHSTGANDPEAVIASDSNYSIYA